MTDQQARALVALVVEAAAKLTEAHQFNTATSATILRACSSSSDLISLTVRTIAGKLRALATDEGLIRRVREVFEVGDD